jgi:hypothetical protein
LPPPRSFRRGTPHDSNARALLRNLRGLGPNDDRRGCPAPLNHKAKTGLDQLDEEAEALAKRERALVAEDEAQRLRREAAKAKSARKRVS